MMNKEIKCLYCNRGIKDGIAISESHIIPDAIVNKKIAYKNVCKIDHNSVFGNTFECEVIERMKTLTHFLGIYNKDRKIQPYYSHLKVNDVSFIKKICLTKSVLDRPITIKENGTKKVLGKITQAQIDKNPDKIEIFDKLEVYEEFNFEDIINMLYSRSMLRLVAKIGYEWYCKENGINGVHKEFEQIIKYIVEEYYNGEEIVSIVTNRKFVNKLHVNYDNGSYVLWIDYSQDKKAFYTMFDFLGLVLYKVKVRNTLIDISSPLKSRNLTYIRRDGDVSKIKMYFNNFDEMFNSICSQNGVENQKGEIIEQLREIVTKFSITLKGLKPFVDEIITYELSSANNVCERLQLVPDRMIQAVLVLELLGKYKEEYDYSQDFIKNTYRIIPTENKEYILNPGTRLAFLKSLIKNKEVLWNIKDGIELYEVVYCKELKKN